MKINLHLCVPCPSSQSIPSDIRTDPVKQSRTRGKDMELIGNRSQVAKAWVCKTSIRRFESDRFLQRHSTHHFFTWLVDRTRAPDQRFKAENSSETFFLQIPVSFIYTYNIHAGRSPPLSVHTFQLSPPRSIYLLRLSFHSEVYVYGSTAPGSERLMLDLNALTRWWGPMEESRGGGRNKQGISSLPVVC